MDDLASTLLDLERRGWDSLCAGTGDRFYEDLMTPDALMVLANGAVLDRDAVVASLAEAPPWREYAISDAHVLRLGGDSAVLVYTGTARRDGGGSAFVGAMSSVYVRIDDGWRLALYQQTPLPAA